MSEFEILLGACFLLGLPRITRGNVGWWLALGPALSGIYTSSGGDFQVATLAVPLVLACMVILRAGRGRVLIGQGLLAAGAFSIYAAALALSLPPYSLGLAAIFLSIPAFVAAGSSAATSNEPSWPLLAAATLVAGDVALEGLGWGLGGGQALAADRASGIFTLVGGPNLAGVYCALLCVIHLAQVLDPKVGRMRIPCALVGVVCLLGLLATVSRRALLALVAAVAVVAFTRWGLSKGVIAASVAAIAMYFAAPILLSPFLGSFEGRFASFQEDRAYRATEYALLVDASRVGQVFGGGIDSGRYYFIQPATPTAFIPVHNSLLFVAIAFGALGLILLLVPVTQALARGYTAAKAHPNSALLAGLGALVVVLVSSVAGEMFILGPFMVTFWFAVGQLANMEGKKAWT